MTADSFKSTDWIVLAAAECTIIDRHDGGGYRVRHPLLTRPRWFNRSRRGNLYSRYTGKNTDACAAGYLIEGPMS